eukprot:gene8707-6123_t
MGLADTFVLPHLSVRPPFPSHTSIMTTSNLRLLPSDILLAMPPTEDMCTMSGSLLGDKLQERYSGSEIMRYFSASDQEQLKQEVVNAINHELVHPEDLETVVPKLLRSCESEGAELRRSMNSIVSLQIVEAQRALDLVRSSSERVNGLRQHFLRQAELVQGMQGETLPSKHLRQLHTLRANVSAVVRWATALKEVRYENLFILAQRRQFSTLYEKIKQLQRIRETVISKAGSRYRVFEAVFEPYFSKLDLICDAVTMELYSLLEEDGANIAIQKALMDDDLQDPPGFAPFKECCRVCMEELVNPVLQITGPTGNREPSVTVSKLRACVAKNILKLWKQQVMIDAMQPLENANEYFNRLKKVEPLMEALQMTLVPLSSPNFYFFDVVLKVLHGRVLEAMSVFVENKDSLDANVLLEASQFIQWYRGMLSAYNYAAGLDLKEADDLTAVFMTTAVSGLSTHLSRLCKACALSVLKQQPSLPQVGRLPGSCGPVDLFAILQQTLGGLSAAIDITVMEDIGNACVDAILTYLTTCRAGMDYDVWEEQAAANPEDEDWQQRRLLLLYALSNDCGTVEANLDSVEAKFAVCWDMNPLSGGTDGNGARHDSPFQRIQDYLPELNLFYLDEITDQVERVVADQWTLAFREGPWYGEETNPLQLILVTEAEYVEEEFKLMLPEPKVRKLTTKMLTRYAKQFLSSLMEFLADVIRNPKKNNVTDWSVFIDNLVRDIELSDATWRRLTKEINGDLLNTCMDAMSIAKELLCVKKVVDLDFLLRDKLMERFGDCPTFVLRYTIECRPKEVSAESRERMLAVWSGMVRSQQRNDQDIPTAGWNRPSSLFGQLDRAIGQFYKAGGFFSKSAKKKLLAERQRQAQDEKERKRKARLDMAAPAAEKHEPLWCMKRTLSLSLSHSENRTTLHIFSLAIFAPLVNRCFCSLLAAT